MKRLCLLLLLSVGLTACQKKTVAVSNEPAVDFPAVLQSAKSENKHVLLEFTGSDWCPPCMQMHEEVLTKPEFLAYAKSNLIFVVLDFPNEKPQSAAQKKTNEELAEKFKAEAFPTFILLNPAGNEVWREVGAFAKTPAEFIAPLESVRNKSATSAAK